MLNRPHHMLVMAAAFAIAGCGGGGGGDASTPGPANGTSTGGVTTISLAQGTSVQTTWLGIDNAGELTVFWRDQSAGSVVLKAANANAAGLLSQATVAPNVFVAAHQVVPLSPRRYLSLYPAITGSASRIIEFQDSGSSTLSLAVPISSPLSAAAQIVGDAAGNLYAFTGDTTAPFPRVTLAGNVDITLVTRGPSGYASLEGAAIAGSESSDPQAWMAAIGRPQGVTARGVYVNQVSLSTGSVSSPVQVSTGEVLVQGNSISTCFADPRIRSTGPATTLTTWRQSNAARNGCDLMVNGQRVNAGAWSVSVYDVTALPGGGAMAVWEEIDPVSGFDRRMRFASKPSSAGTWSAPGPIDASRANMTAFRDISASGPGGTLAIAWDAGSGCTTSSCQITDKLVSKYANGTWMTRSISDGSSRQKIAINASGEAVVAGSRNCGASCSELVVHRF
jgi:hypothetical protein